MDIRVIRHKGLRRFIENDDASGLPADFVEKIRNIISFLQEMESSDELKSIATWRAHQLTGDRKGTWSLIVTRNWRITFRIDASEKVIVDLDYEDYH
ncbi:MAG TPA: type II toxin-antitoxin system RelE/ParE family toxin [Roseiarcus sp.]|jgi:proteic killer suppression protein